MAFSTAAVNAGPRARGARVAAVDAASQDDWERAAGFINLYLPNKQGGRRKLGAIPLKKSVANEKMLLEWLMQDEGNAAKLLSVLQVEFRTSEPDPNAAFALPE